MGFLAIYIKHHFISIHHSFESIYKHIRVSF